jgi:predicted phage terminase large subunit-like protein
MADREKARASIRSLTDLSQKLEDSLRKGTTLSDVTKRNLLRLAERLEARDPKNLLAALLDNTEKMEVQYQAQLGANADRSFSCFVEFMTPDEVPAPHHEWMCDKLEAIERREILRATFSMPPGHAKTKFCSRFFPAWYLGRNPIHRYLQGGHSQTYVENEFGKYVRDIVADPRFRTVFPDITLHTRSTAAGNWKLSNLRGGYVCRGVGQKLSGYRGHCGGVDDAFGSSEDADSPTIRAKTIKWLFADFRTRFLPHSPIFLVATRWHPEDLIGYVEQLNKEKRGIPWQVFNLNGIIENEAEAAVDPLGRDIGEALWADFYSPEVLMDFKATLPTRDWWALYKGQPRDDEGNVVKLSWFKRYTERPQDRVNEHGHLERFIKRITVSVDTANTTKARSAYTVCTVWAECVDGCHYLLDVVRKKVEFNELIPLIEDTAARWKAHAILVEDKGNGTAYIQQRAGKAPCPIIPIMPEAEGNKEFRFDAVTTQIEGGTVLLPARAPWLADYEAELLGFPNTAFKDQVDSTSQYLNWAGRRRTLGTKKLHGTGHRGTLNKKRRGGTRRAS